MLDEASSFLINKNLEGTKERKLHQVVYNDMMNQIKRKKGPKTIISLYFSFYLVLYCNNLFFNFSLFSFQECDITLGAIVLVGYRNSFSYFNFPIMQT